MANLDAVAWKSMEWRQVGPFRGGRVMTVAGDPVNPLVFYFGAHIGGVWKTYDAGTYWHNISDGFFNTSSIGAIAVSQSDPNVIYAGTGEACFQSSGDESQGDGVYKSTDAGTSWTHVGLDDTRHIGRIRIHPTNPNLVYVAALGHSYGPNEQRGIFRSKDGGSNWERVLFKSDKAGAIDLSMDLHNPRILYASIYQFLRTPWTHISGGPDSGIYKSIDGGDTWNYLSDKPGMPTGLTGRSGIAVSPANPERVWALIEAEDGGLFRSDDSGDTWSLATNRPDLWMRAPYYTHVFAHPKDEETCYIMSVEFNKSIDGGANFTSYAMPHGDNHDLWIDPQNPDRMIQANDGGATVTLNGGATWSSIYNQPTASFFHVTTDNQFPYRVYGTQFDNTAISTPSQSSVGAISWSECYPVGSSESGHIAVRPDNSNIVYAGAIGSSPGGGGNFLRYDHGTGQTRIITVWPESQSDVPGKDWKYRFQFHFPNIISPHDPNTQYVAANVVFKSQDEGTSWEVISPDLTYNDDSVMTEVAGGLITKQGQAAVFNIGSIMALAESIHQKGEFWVGSDDGLIHISRDDGGSWQNITPPGMQKWTHVNNIDLSEHNPGTAYVSVTRFRLDDWTPLLYRTHDYGETWKVITQGLPDNDFTRVIREDPSRSGLLYVGTERGIYVSFDYGENWKSLQLNLPVVPIYDLVIKNQDLVAATHGRAFWIMDDLTPLHQLTEEVVDNSVHLFKPRPTYRSFPQWRPIRGGKPGINYQAGIAFYETKGNDSKPKRTYLNAGENPPNGVVVSYFLEKDTDLKVTLEFGNDTDGVIRSFVVNDDQMGEATLERGMNRFVWDMRLPGAIGDTTIPGPVILAGSYWVKITVGDYTQTESFIVLEDPRVAASYDDLKSQFGLLVKLRDKLTESNETVSRLRKIKKQLIDWQGRSEKHPEFQRIDESARDLNQRLFDIEEMFVPILGANPQKPPPTRLTDKLVSLHAVVSSADWVPTSQSYQVFDLISRDIDTQIASFNGLLKSDLQEFTELISELDIPGIISA